MWLSEGFSSMNGTFFSWQHLSISPELVQSCHLFSLQSSQLLLFSDFLQFQPFCPLFPITRPLGHCHHLLPLLFFPCHNSCWTPSWTSSHLICVERQDFDLNQSSTHPLQAMGREAFPVHGTAHPKREKSTQALKLKANAICSTQSSTTFSSTTSYHTATNQKKPALRDTSLGVSQPLHFINFQGLIFPWQICSEFLHSDNGNDREKDAVKCK